MAIVRKRLHISGLTPSITEYDIRDRLEKFVEVKAIDEFGKLNALGEPRKFAYATVDATEQNLARCFNHLSGTTWKGAKLRIGEAKPDFIQRLKSDRERQDAESPKKRQRLPRGVQGVHAKDMSLVTTGNVNSRPGWHKTTLSHLIRPMKMRPSRPLPTLPSELPSKMKSKSRRKAVHLHSRAHIQKIDPRLWDPVHVTEKMLQSVVIAPSVPVTRTAPLPSINNTISFTPFSHDTSKAPVVEPEFPTTETKIPIPPTNRPEIQQTPPAANTATEYDTNPDIQQENIRHLELLSRMFGNSSDDDDWNAPETVQENLNNSDESENENTGNKAAEFLNRVRPSSSSHDVPHGKGGEMMNSGEDVVMEEANKSESLELNENEQNESSQTPDYPSKSTKPQERSLKDLFKPQENTNFSLIAGLDLDLDLELDLDPAFDLSKPSEHQVQTSDQAQAQSSIVQPSTSIYHNEGLTLDSSLPFFFPQPDNSHSKDFISIAKTQGWHFYRTDDSETIRKRWDEIKGGLTHEWKKRSREAVKARRRRFGADAIEES